jgi:hypothetical protein
MNRSTALLVLTVIAAGGWLAGKWLAESQAPAGTPALPDRWHAQEESAVRSADLAARNSRDFRTEWAAAAAITDRQKRIGQLTQLGIDWAKVDPRPALKALMEAASADKEPDRTRWNSAFMYLFESWSGTHGWEAAFAAAKDIGDGNTRESVMRQLGHEALRDGQNPRGRLTELLAVAPDNDRAALLSGAVRLWGRSAGADPSEMIAWADALPRGSIPPHHLARVERDTASACMAKNPRLAADWLMARATPDNRSEHLRILVSEWAVSAPNACGEWLREQPFGPDMDHAVETFSRIIVRRDGESAVQWASRISDPARRSEVLRDLLEQWRLFDPAAAGESARRLQPEGQSGAGLSRGN